MSAQAVMLSKMRFRLEIDALMSNSLVFAISCGCDCVSLKSFLRWRKTIASF